MSNHFFALIAVLYFIAANLTGGYIYNKRCDQDSYSCPLESVYGGAGWPIYWSARAGLAVTK
jgi:hypothetical protein